MSLYNLINGMNASFAVLMSPFLPRIPEDFPRFRDIFSADDDDSLHIKGDIYIYTRMGGGNRDCWGSESDPCDCAGCEADRLEEEDENCLGSYDDDFDCTYRTFVYQVNDEDRNDYLIMTGKIEGIPSERYQGKLREMYKDRPEILKFIDETLAAIIHFYKIKGESGE